MNVKGSILKVEKKETDFTNLGQNYHRNRKENKLLPNNVPKTKSQGLFKTGIYKQPNFTRKESIQISKLNQEKRFL